MTMSSKLLLFLVVAISSMCLFALTSVHADDSNTNSTDSDAKKEMRMMMKEMMKEMMMPEKCQGKHLNYAGTYNSKAAVMSYDTTTSTLKGIEDQTFQRIIMPGSAGKTSWIMNKYTDPATRNVTDPTMLAQAEAGAGVEVDALCFAPPPKWGGKGMMSCVDTLDSGHTTFIPDEVNDDCEVVTASYVYTEAATVGCTETMCMPSIAHVELTRFTEE
ncbi:hypothetical protein PPROV_000560500 [Pycnococcus provasolii]|uniref:Uncharacterized protein n=1 Tax=Pycnococcus provasolii TaxID=41880 RepID=A0A830HMU0_9CHLO|nr:hypothetical protein PPROV_000560500 [Pycnococcus provasolii]|mmetsp:Transcript_10029/g.22621  ORF Transcript_10029/g.22621 Transcript_10029/m.22621 type:complete len:217 (+) Transcript_10029:37-687(+)